MERATSTTALRTTQMLVLLNASGVFVDHIDVVPYMTRTRVLKTEPTIFLTDDLLELQTPLEKRVACFVIVKKSFPTP